MFDFLFEDRGLFFIIVFGGLLFAFTSCMIIRFNPPIRTRYILNFFAYYLLGPLAWGLWHFFSEGNDNRLIFFTVTFWAFVGFFAIGVAGVRLIEKWIHRNG